VKKKKRKHLRFLIEATEVGGGEYIIDVTQLTNIPIPLTEFEKNYTFPLKDKPITNENFNQAIEAHKKYIQQIAQNLNFNIAIKVKKS
jgi:formylglycine-generating enzyme required for sulfatase activity